MRHICTWIFFSYYSDFMVGSQVGELDDYWLIPELTSSFQIGGSWEDDNYVGYSCYLILNQKLD